MLFFYILLTIFTSSTTLVTALPTRPSTRSSQDTRTTSYQRPRDPPIVIAPPGLLDQQKKEYRDKVHEDYNGLSFRNKAPHTTFASVVDPWHEAGDGKLPHPIYKALDATSNRERPKREGDVVGYRHAGSREAPSPVGQVRGGGHVGSSSRTGIDDVREGKRPRTRVNNPVRQGWKAAAHYKALRTPGYRVLRDIRNTQREVGDPPFEHAVEPNKLDVWYHGILKQKPEQLDLRKKVQEHYGMLPASDPSRAAVAVRVFKGFHIGNSEDKEEHATVRYYYLTKDGRYRVSPGIYHVYKDGPAYRPWPPESGRI